MRKLYCILLFTLIFAIGCSFGNKPDRIHGYWLRIDNPYYSFLFDETSYTFRKKATASKGTSAQDTVKTGTYFMDDSGLFVLSVDDGKGSIGRVRAEIRHEDLFVEGKRFVKMESVADQERCIAEFENINL